MTHTVTYANPYLACNTCGLQVVETVDEPEQPLENRPCGHTTSFESVCPSWGPVDGCSCLATLGYVPHPDPLP